jgi:hypothetical protein
MKLSANNLKKFRGGLKVRTNIRAGKKPPKK